MTKIFSFVLLLALFLGVAPQAQTAPAQVRLVTPQALKAEIANNKGKVVLVRLWATWDARSRVALRTLAQLQTTNKNLVLLLVSVDDPGDKKKVADFAGQCGHHITRQISSDIDIFLQGFDPKNTDTPILPRAYLYNKKGALVKMVAEEKSLAGYQSLIKPYL